MNEAIVKEEVIEETNNFTFINGEYVEVKQEEEVEQKPEYLLENEIKTEMNDDCFEANEPDEYFEDVKPEPKECDTEFEKLSAGFSLLKCGICQKRMPKNLLKLISEEDKTVLSVFFFKIEGSLKIKSPYVCYSHIQTIIDENGSKLKSPRTRYEQILRSFMTKNKRSIARHNCQVCHMLKNRCELYKICSKGIRMVIMIGRILRGTHSVEQAKDYINNTDGLTCYSHCKKSIDKILEHLGVRNTQEFPKCSPPMMTGLMDIAKKIDSNFTIDQFIEAFRRLFLKNKTF
ncbi:unnamed protein product [Caenorhabditis nigoni]